MLSGHTQDEVFALIFHRQRGEARTRVAVKARMQIGTFDDEVMILNAASAGVLVAVDNPPARGTRIELVIGEMVLAGTVRWRGVDCCGIALADPISVADLIEGQAVPIAMVSEPRGLRSKLRALAGDWS